MNTEDSPLLQWMTQHNIPLTRERYLALDFMGNPPEELDAVYESMMPSLPLEADIIVGHALGVEVTDAFDLDEE